MSKPNRAGARPRLVRFLHNAEGEEGCGAYTVRTYSGALLQSLGHRKTDRLAHRRLWTGAVAMGRAKQQVVIVRAEFGGMEAAQRLVPGLAEIVPVNCMPTS